MLFRAAIVALLCAAAWGQSAPPSPNPNAAVLDQFKECAQKRTPASCGVSKKVLKQAQRDFTHGLRLQNRGKSEEAFSAIESAASLVPRDLEYATAREVLRQKIVYDRVQNGNTLLLANKDGAAAAEFREALKLDPENAFALQRLEDSAQFKPKASVSGIRVVDEPGQLRLEPHADVRGSYHFRGNTRALYETIGDTFGLTPKFDESVTPRQVRFDIEDVDYPTAMRMAGVMTKTFVTPLSADEFLVVADSAQNRSEFQRMAMRSFYIPGATTAQDLTDLVNLLRTVFEIRYITSQPATSTLTVRAPRGVLDAATLFMESLDSSRPQVMLEFQVFQVSGTLTRSMGVSLPLQWQVFQLGSAALALLGQSNTQNLINQLIASGGINQANNTAVAALLAQLQNQSQNPLLQQPFATFGGGQTLSAVPIPRSTINFSQNESLVANLQHLTLRASHGVAATMRIGTRFPILNATFAPIFNTPAIAQVIQNNSFVAPFPSFSYEDLGLIVKATPRIHRNGDVSLELNVEIRALGAQSFNGVPVISNRMYTGSITVKDGEAGVVAGTLDHSEQNSLTGIPGIVHLPLLGTATSSHGKQTSNTELLVLITPHLTSTRERPPALITIPSS